MNADHSAEMLIPSLHQFFFPTRMFYIWVKLFATASEEMKIVVKVFVLARSIE